MSKDEKKNRTLTQQGAFRKDRNAMNRAEKNEINDGEIINQMALTHSNPNSAQAYSEASGAVIHVRGNMNKETPISDAVDAILAERKALNNNGRRN
ncbi:hypothetical protein [Endozoicomonas euniceicola]|uniref:Uncharacterized protein n=1 Tax=Endozoicomonas euniceicola TaxID=1234143 RepID=A0ABY6GPA2_9GAMM|nr:hypothetical protein [Endozoicomonas euniceicola]UYM14586.1 hypothetical protein NX720_17035 [Endozoicomonas euniceicola]